MGSIIKYGILDLLRGLGMGIVDIIFKTIDVLFDVAYKINSLNFIEILKNLENSPFTKIFNAFFILSFIVLFLFSVWKITFKILDADNNDQSMFDTVKEIVKCGFLIFGIYLIFNTTINLGINLSSSIYNNFTSESSTIGDRMKSSYLTMNEACYKLENGDDEDKQNVADLKEKLSGYIDVSSAKTMEDFEKLIRSGKLTATHVSDSGSLSYRCDIYKPGIWNDEEDYAFNYNFLFGIVMGGVFLFSVGFSVLMLGRRQLELAFLMVISPLVIATSIGRKEQRSALYQQLTSLILQAGAMMLLIGLTSIMFNAIQNSGEINNLPYFTKIVAQTVLYLGCAMLLMTGCTSINRFIGENVSANSGRDMLMAVKGLGGGIMTAGAAILGSPKTMLNVGKSSLRSGKGIGQFAKGVGNTSQALYHRLASFSPKMTSAINSRMNEKLNKGTSKMNKGINLQNSNNPFYRSYGKHLEKSGRGIMQEVNSKWDFEKGQYNPNSLRSGFNLAREGLSNIGYGFSGVTNSIKNIGNPKKNYYQSAPQSSGSKRN